MAKRKKEERVRFTSKWKAEAVMRLLKGEDLDSLSRELTVTAATLSDWREAFLAGAEANLKSREPTPADDDNLRLKAKIGEFRLAEWEDRSVIVQALVDLYLYHEDTIDSSSDRHGATHLAEVALDLCLNLPSG